MPYKLPISDSEERENIRQRFDAIIANTPARQAPEFKVEESAKDKAKELQCIVCGDGAATLHNLFCDDSCMNKYNDATNYGKEIDSDQFLPTWDEVKSGNAVVDVSDRIQRYRVNMIKQKEEQTEALKRKWEETVKQAKENGTY